MYGSHCHLHQSLPSEQACGPLLRSLDLSGPVHEEWSGKTQGILLESVSSTIQYMLGVLEPLQLLKVQMEK